MARTSKYNNNHLATAENKKEWVAALYIRLSREDGDKDESDSIANQRLYLNSFIENDTDIKVFDTFIDDGYSGTTFERPEFQKMIDCARKGLINCIVVKDLSRFGRNYIEVGNYVEQILPFLNIRFISINDSLDSFSNPQSMNTILVPFKNLINDEYCRDISNKVRSSLDTLRRQGKHIGSFAAYGYLKDPEDKHHLIIDDYAAGVVRKIYSLFLEGYGLITIAKHLNGLGYLNPTAYKKQIGLNYRHPCGVKNDTLWNEATIRRILKNQLYTGTLVQGINRIKSYKVQVSEIQPKENWFITEDTHEAIISRDTFEKVQSLFRRDTRTSPSSDRLYLFSGFLRCGDCGRSMNRKTNKHSYGTYVYYNCSTYKKIDKSACSKHSIRHDRLCEAVLLTIQQQIQLVISIEEILNRINTSDNITKGSRTLERTLSERIAERQKLEEMKLNLYPDWKHGDISREEYLALKGNIDSKCEIIDKAIYRIRKEMSKYENGIDSNNTFVSSFIKHKGINELNREILNELVEDIFIHEDQQITIQFRFSDEFERVLEFIDTNNESTEAS